MKIALISDIHANLPALEAVLAHAGSLGVKGAWCLGDLVQFNAFPEEVVRLIRKLKAPCIYGNIDRLVMETGAALKKKAVADLPAEGQPFAWTYNQLTKKDRKFLSGIPEAIAIKYKGYSFLLVHGSPAANDDPIYADTPQERLDELAAMVKADLVLCGHTHKPFLLRSGRVSFINPGSVGRTIDHDTRASYAVLDIKKSGITVEFYRVEYDVAVAVNAIRQAGLPELYAVMAGGALTPDEARAGTGS